MICLKSDPTITETNIPPGGTPILGHIRDVLPEWVSFPGRKPADGCTIFDQKPADGS